MSRRLVMCALSLAMLGGLPTSAAAQEDDAERKLEKAVTDARASQEVGTETPLRVRIVISRRQNGKQVSRVPYTMSVVSNEAASQLRMTTRVPVPSGERTTEQGSVPARFTYEEVGTSIDCHAHALPDGRFRLMISIMDSSVYGEKSVGSGTAGLVGPPSFRVMRSTQRVLLADGASTQYMMATDKITGEVIEVEISLQVAGR